MVKTTAAQVALDSSNLPIVIIETYGQVIVDDPRITVFMGIIDNGTGNMNHISDPYNNYNGEVTIEIRGSTSQQLYPKKSYAFTPVDSFGNKINVSILGFPEESDWILYAPYTDKTLMRNTLAYHLFNRMEHYASRTHFVELILDGSYIGVYELQEKIKRDVNRVDIATLAEQDTLGDQLTGGYIIKIDKTTGSGYETWTSGYDSEVFFQYHDPDEFDLLPVQKNYIQDYVHLFETALNDPDFADPDSGYRAFADENSFIDYMLIEELGHTVDGYRSSCFMYKDKDSNGGKLTMGPLWDFSSSFGNANYCNAYNVEGWQYEFNSYCDGFFPHVPFWWQRLFEDPLFADHVKCRWNLLRENSFTTDSIHHWIDSAVLILDEAKERNFEKWDILGQYVDWNYYIGETYQDEITYLKDWIEDRAIWMDANLPGNCLPTFVLEEEGNALHISPNPFTQEASIYVSENNHSESGKLLLFNALGEQMMEKNFEGKEIRLQRNGLPSGIYLIQIRQAEKIIAIGKLIAM